MAFNNLIGDGNQTYTMVTIIIIYSSYIFKVVKNKF